MPTLSSRLPFRLMSSMLLAGALLTGCAQAPSSGDLGPVVAPPPSSVPSVPSVPSVSPVSPDAPDENSAVTDVDQLKTLSVSSLTPAQGVDDRNVGARIRWAGAVQSLNATNEGGCLTMMYARSDNDGAPHWTNEPTYKMFLACAQGAYDPALVGEFTNLTIVGRISGKTSIGIGGGTVTGPVVEIEKLFRWSDCPQGDQSPQCRYGFISPLAVP